MNRYELWRKETTNFETGVAFMVWEVDSQSAVGWYDEDEEQDARIAYAELSGDTENADII